MYSNTHHIVAIVGRPNVGKSTLFNRIVGRSKAITTPEAGGTRDRNYDIAEWCGRTFALVDTGGYLPGEDGNFESAIRKQVRIAVQECDVILFLVDCKSGLLPNDYVIAEMLRKAGKPIVMVANKADNAMRALVAPSFQALGLGDVYPISASHGRGTGDLMDAIVGHMDDSKDEQVVEGIPRIAFVGKPNVGKSTLMNALLNQERSIVSEQPHTTRDALHSLYNLYGQRFMITDTAGIYRKNKYKEAIEFYSVIRSVKVMQQSDICIVMIEASKGLTKQDLHILQLAHQQRKGIILAVNKWDLVDKSLYDGVQYRKDVSAQLGTLSYVPVVFISGLTKQRIYHLMKKTLEVYHNRKQRLGTPLLNTIIQKAITQVPPPVIKGKYVKIKYATQIPLSAPTIALFANLPQYISTTYKRYLTNQLRNHFNFEGVPLTIVCKKK